MLYPVISRLVLLPSISGVTVVNRVYMVDLFDTASLYLRTAYENRNANRPSESYPESWLVFYNANYIVDVVPDGSDFLGLTFLMTIYNSVNSGPRTMFNGVQILQEGPFRLRALHDHHKIQPEPLPLFDPSNWLLNRLGRPPRTFTVVPRDTVTYYVPHRTHGNEWMRSQHAPARVQNALNHGQRLLIDAMPNPEYPPGGSIYVRIWSYEDPKVVHARGDPNEIYFAGPYLLRPLGHYNYFHLIRSHEITWRWLIQFFIEQRQAGREFRDFFTSTDPPNQFRSIASSILVPHQRQCMRADIRYFIDLTYPIEEFYITQGHIEVLPDPDSGIRRSVPESIDIRLEGREKVVAQTIHTDHLDFTFDVPRDSVGRSWFHLLLCILTGDRGMEAKLS